MVVMESWEGAHYLVRNDQHVRLLAEVRQQLFGLLPEVDHRQVMSAVQPPLSPGAA